MSYVEYQAKLKKINLKPDGTKEIVLETEDLNGILETLSDMIGTNISVTHDDKVVRYRVPIHPRTKEELKQYKVDNHGVVEEVKPQGEQLEMELDGVPKEQVKPDLDKREIDKEIIDDFIASGLAPAYDDLDIYFPVYIERLRTGETYLKFANELGLTSERIAEMFDEYRKRVAPLAVKWDEWRKGQPAVQSQNEEVQAEDVTQKQSEDDGSDDQEAMSDQTDSETVEFEEKIDSNQSVAEEREISKEELEIYILNKKPSFEDISIDFPSHLEKRRTGHTWMEIARELGITSTQLQSAWSKYKQKVKEQMNKDVA